MQPNQQVTFLTDGGDDVRELPLYLNPQAEHVLDWFHITMRLSRPVRIMFEIRLVAEPRCSSTGDGAYVARG